MHSASDVEDALTPLGLGVTRPGSDGGPDLVVTAGESVVAVELKRYSTVTDDVARRLVATSRRFDVLLVVADRVTADARAVLTVPGLGYYDRRGHLAFRTGTWVIDADVPAVREQAPTRDPFRAAAGREVVIELLREPRSKNSVRDLARRLDRAPSTVSDVLAVLRSYGLVDAVNAVTDDRLFWRLAEAWGRSRTLVAALPDRHDPVVQRALRLGIHEGASSGWALTDAAAAARLGAPVAVAENGRLDFYVPDAATLRRAVTLLLPAPQTSTAVASVAVAPVPAVVSGRVSIDESTGWPLAHPLFVALDLAQDEGRGREVLDAWTPPDPWHRVW